MVESDFWTKFDGKVRNEKWGERYRETALCLFYNLKFGTLDAWRIHWMRGASNQSCPVVKSQPLVSSDAWRIHWMRGASSISRQLRRLGQHGWKPPRMRGASVDAWRIQSG